jgi:hypothetical protein
MAARALVSLAFSPKTVQRSPVEGYPQFCPRTTYECMEYVDITLKESDQ